MKIKFADLGRQYNNLKKEIDKAIQPVLSSGNFILGKEVESFEKEFAEFCEAKYCVAVASGTDGLFLSLKALGIGAGDEVITTPHSFISTALAISMAGARPVFVDINPATYNIDVKKIEEKINSKTKAILPVHLYGQSADMGPIKKIAKQHNLKILEDACQAHGARYKGRRVGNFGDLAVFSFVATKNLGCFGDGGAVVTNNLSLANQVRLLHVYGTKDEKTRYRHIIKGYNSRLDALQAAILRVKLKYLEAWNKQRAENAALYDRLLAGLPIFLPYVASWADSVFHLYVIRTERRDELQKFLAIKGIATGIHYPIPIHLQPAYKDLACRKGDFPVCEKVAGEILSLPIGPELKKEEIKYIAENIRKFYQKNKLFITVKL